MMAKKLKNKDGIQRVLPGEPRRSQRVSSLPRNDYYLMGSGNLQEILGLDNSEEDYRPKRSRKNYRFDDSSDYEDAGRHPRKKHHVTNRVETLLEWRTQTINPIESEQQFAQCYPVKSICNENLDKFGKGIEALFINIQWDKKGQTLEDFKKIKIDSNILMKKGIVFIWSPKQLLSSLMQIMDKKNFFYVQNFEIINLDRQLALQSILSKQKLKKTSIEDTSSSPDIIKKQKIQKDQQELNQNNLIKKLIDFDPTSLIIKNKSQYFNESKKTLLMFRKISHQKIQLRHQRTCDVVFDMPLDPHQKCSGNIKNYVFRMIQTLLPRGLQLNSKKDSLKMMELWGESNSLRRGWINIFQK